MSDVKTENLARHRENPEKILVVDDNESVLRSLEGILQRCGYIPLLALSAQEALNILQQELPDLILCDVMMPQIDGFEFHRKIMEKPGWCDIPFILLTALSKPEQVRFAKQSGCDDYITKPFDPLDLISVIKGKLELSKQREEKFDRYRKRIVHTLSHEFRTPLVAINTGAELLLDQYKTIDEQKLKHLLLSIQRGGQRLQRLVEDFMLLQQIDSGTAISVCRRMRSKASLQYLVESAIDSFLETMNGEQEIEIELRNVNPAKNIRQNQGNLLVLVYDHQIVDVIGRLLSNAYKFGGAGNKITVEMNAHEKEILVMIRDSGPGLPEHVLRSALELFTQIDRDKLEQQGCGIGLTIAKYFTEINGGKLNFRNLPSGLEVELSFPHCTD